MLRHIYSVNSSTHNSFTQISHVLRLSVGLTVLLAVLYANAADQELLPREDTAASHPIELIEAGMTGDRWKLLRSQIFGDRDIQSDTGVLLLDAPGRAFDAARVPVTVHATQRPTDDTFIRKLYLIVDNNPAPVAGTFTFEPNNGWSTIDTELRINEYSELRAVAEMSDGSLHMANRFVKAVGGCSAPPSSYERSETTQMGKFKGGVEQLLNPKVPAIARIRMIHPNASGMQFDQFTRTFIQPHFIHTIGAEFNGKTLFTLATNFSLSQDPVLGFNFKPERSGKLEFYAIDSKDKRFEQTWEVTATQSN